MSIVSTHFTSRTTRDVAILTAKYKGLCVGVGGIKGLLEAGGINVFWIRNQLDELTHYAGSSAGSMICYLLIIGYEPIDVLRILCSSDLSSKFSTINFMNLSTLFGLYPNSILKNKLEEITMLKIGYFPTFKQLYEKMGKYFIVTNYCLSETNISDRKIYCSPETTPDMNVIDSIVISCSLPIIFQKATMNNKTYIDGAFTSKFPINALQNSMPANSSILGIFLCDQQSNMDNFFGYMTELLSVSLREQNELYNLNKNTHVVELNDTTSSLSFNIATKDKVYMFSRGMKCVKELFTFIESENKVSKTKIE